ncbi:MAG TPA: type II toxin-antitoxin system VapB family antitoxin [Terracidiphilus sp.]|nr:type II toxin-antitoxin system VapB family antitoxin [Terracidiphilus sp.]
MRTNIDIDDKLMKQAMKATGAATKKAAVEAAFRLAIQLHQQGEAILNLRGLGWEGDIDEMRGRNRLDEKLSRSAAKGRRSVAA